MGSGDVHVLPVNDLVDHAEHGRVCWCQPAIKALCEECEGAGCWKCKDGLVLVGVRDSRSALIVHNAADGRE